MSDLEPKSKTYIITRPDVAQKPEWWPKKKPESFFFKYLETTQEQFEIMTEAYLYLSNLYSEKRIEDKLSPRIYKGATCFSKSANFITSLVYNLIAQSYPLIYTNTHSKAMIEMVVQANYYTQKIQALRMDCVLNGKFPNTIEFSNFFEADSLKLSEVLNRYQEIQKLTPSLQINKVTQVKFDKIY